MGRLIFVVVLVVLGYGALNTGAETIGKRADKIESIVNWSV